MTQDTTTATDVKAAPRVGLLLFAQIAAFEVAIAIVGVAPETSDVTGIVWLGLLLGEIAFLVSLLICSTLHPLARFGLAATVPASLFLLDPAPTSGHIDPGFVLADMAFIAAASLLRLAGLRIATEPRHVTETAPKGGQFKLSQLLIAVSLCALVMGYIRLLPLDHGLAQGLIYVIAPLAAGALVATWVVFGRGAIAWRVVSLGLAMLAAVGLGRWFSEFLPVRSPVELPVFYLSQILSATALLGLARWCGFRGYWNHKAPMADAPDARQPPEAAVVPANSSEALRQ